MREKIELGDLILSLCNKAKLARARDAMFWAVGRLGQRTPMYGPLNSVLPSADAGRWLTALLEQPEVSPAMLLAVTQMVRKVDDRYRDIDPSTRTEVADWLEKQNAPAHYITLVKEGGSFDSEERAQVFGESLPPGLRLV